MGEILHRKFLGLFKNSRSVKVVAGNSFIEKGKALLNGSIRVVEGQGNSVTIGEWAQVKGQIRVRGNGNTVIFGKRSKFVGKLSVTGDNQTVVFGAQSTSFGVYILCRENCDIHIGRDCMLSRDIEIRTTDSHSVIDRATGSRLNTPGNIVIGDHVWIGVEAIIAKGSVIPDDSIVGAKSFVSGQFDQTGTIIAGVPARICRKGVTWSRLRKEYFTEDEMTDWQSGD